jgi:hypothetical protein
MAKSSWNSDKILSLSAIFISVLTLMVFIYQTRLIRKQQYLSVYPYVIYGAGGYGTGENFLQLTNSGIGPALIKDVEISYDDKKFSYIYEFVDYITEGDSTINLYYSDITAGLLIPADETKAIVGSLNDHENKLYKVLTSDFKLEIKYESIYGEEWLLSSSEDMEGFGIPIKK